MKVASKDLQVHLAYQESRVQVDQEALTEDEDHPEHQECLDPKVPRVELELMDHLENLDNLVLRDPPETEDHPACLVQLDLWAVVVPMVRRENVATQASPVRKDRLVPRD